MFNPPQSHGYPQDNVGPPQASGSFKGPRSGPPYPSSSSKPFSGCFRCGSMSHNVRRCPQREPGHPATGGSAPTGRAQPSASSSRGSGSNPKGSACIT